MWGPNARKEGEEILLILIIKKQISWRGKKAHIKYWQKKLN